MDQNDTGRKKQLVTALAVLLAIVIIVGATVVAKQNDSADNARNNDSSNSSSQTTKNSDQSGSSGSDTGNTSQYKNGTYSADSTYQSPGGTEKISVRVTVSDGVVTDSSVTTDPTDKEAKEYQAMFIENYVGQVEGKPIESISLSRVSGSSLTSQGFNSALDEIKDQAKA